MQSGKIHSIESMGLVDGPGIRTVIFMQGCDLRCKYCHNPDTWDRNADADIMMTAEQLTEKIKRFKPYFEQSGGGVTFSGGEPLLQPEFLIEMLTRLKAENIHTCLDTAGCGVGRYDEILEGTDLLLYDVKHYEEKEYMKLTGHSMADTKEFLKKAAEAGVPLWIRHVVVPGITDSRAHLENMREYIRTIPNVQRVELLPYHRLGENKYRELGIAYPPADTSAMDSKKVKELQHSIFEQEEEK